MYLRYKKVNFFAVKQHCIYGENTHLRMLDSDLQKLLQPLLFDREIVYSADGIDLGSYHCNYIVILKLYNGEYLFGRIEKVFIINDNTYLFCQKYTILEFSGHFHAYNVQTSDRFSLVKVEELLDYHVLGMYLVGGKLFIPLKYHVIKF